MRDGSTSLMYRLLLIVSIAAVWLLLSYEQAVKILGPWRGLALCAAVLAPAGLALQWVLRRRTRNGDVSRVAAALAAGWIFAACGYFILHPLSERHVFGPGSDRENAIELACRAFLSGAFPYHQLTFLHHPITPMPGALLLAAPFYLAHHIGVENLAWLAAFLAWCHWIFARSWWAAWFAFVFVLFSPCIMQDVVTGGDFFTNFAYIVVLFSLVARSLTRPSTNSKPNWTAWLWPLLLGVALSSRPIYSLLYPCLFALAWQTAGLWVGLRTVLLTILAELGVTLPVYLRDPAHFSPFNVGSNAASVIPMQFHPAFGAFALGLAITSVSLFVRVDLRRALTLFGLALTAVTLPFFVVDRILRPELFPLNNLIYLSPGLLLLVMWALDQLRAETLRVKTL